MLVLVVARMHFMNNVAQVDRVEISLLIGINGMGELFVVEGCYQDASGDSVRRV